MGITEVIAIVIGSKLSQIMRQKLTVKICAISFMNTYRDVFIRITHLRCERSLTEWIRSKA
jgi:hypothetical protein